MARPKKTPKEKTTTQQRVEEAKRFFEEKRENELKNWNALYTGQLFDEAIPDNDRIFVNYTYSNVENKISTLYYKNPKINVQPRKANLVDQQTGQVVDYIKNARNSQETVNYEMKEYAIKKQIRKSLYDWKISGYGVMFTGWDTDVTYAEATQAPQQQQEPPQDTLLPSEGGQMPQRVDMSQFQQPPQEPPQEQQIESINKDRPDFRRLRPDRVYFSPDSEDDDDVYNRYVVIEETVSYEELKKDKRFKQEDVESISSFEFTDTKSDQKSDTLKRVKLYHVWDKDKWCISVKGLDHNLYETENQYKDVFGDQEALPIVLIWGIRKLGEFYPYSDVYITQDQQNHMNKARAAEANHMKRFANIFIFKKGKIDPLDIEKIENAEEGSIIGIDTQDEPLNAVIMALPNPDMTFPFQFETRLIDDTNVIQGINQYQRGSQQDQIKTLGQTQIAEAHSQSRRDQEQMIVEDYVEKIYQRLLQLNQAFLQQPVYTKIVGESGAQDWLSITKDDIQGEFDLQVESGSTVKMDDDVVRKQTLDAFNLLYPLPESMPIKKDLMISVLETIPTMKTIAEKIKGIPQEQLFPPRPPEEPNRSIGLTLNEQTMSVMPDAILLAALQKLGLQVNMQDVLGMKDLLGSMQAQEVQGQAPQEGAQGSPLNPQMLQENTTNPSDILKGVNQA